jgi:hypothetical protein
MNSPSLVPSCPQRLSEAHDRPDIAAWSNQRAADVVRRGIAEANAVFALTAGDAVYSGSSALYFGLRSGQRGRLLGWLELAGGVWRPVVEFDAAASLPDSATGRKVAFRNAIDPGALSATAPKAPSARQP